MTALLLILKIIYLPAGIFVNRKFDILFIPYMIFFHVCLIFAVICILLVYTDPNSSYLENTYTLYSASTILVSFWAGYLNRNYYYHLYEEIKEYSSQSKDFSKISNQMLKKISKLTIAIYSTQLFLLPVPIYALLFANASYSDRVVLFFPTWYPWKRDTFYKYVSTMVLQFLTISSGYCLLTFFVGSFASALLYIYTRFCFLRDKILTLEERIVKQTKNKGNAWLDNYLYNPSFLLCDRTIRRELDELLYEEILSLVKEHQVLIRFTRETVNNFSFPVSIVLAYGLVTAILMISVIIQQGDEHKLQKIKVAASSSLAVISLSLCCVCGEVLLNLNDILIRAVYDTSWYKYSFHLRKLIIMFILQNQRRFEVKAFGMFVLCLSYLGIAFKVCYSFIQVLGSNK